MTTSSTHRSTLANPLHIGQPVRVIDAPTTVPDWVENLYRGLEAAGFRAEEERRGDDASSERYWAVLVRPSLTVILYHDDGVWDVIVETDRTSPSLDRWANRRTGVHLLRAVHDGTLDQHNWPTTDPERDGLWMIANLDLVEDLMRSDRTWRDLYELDRAWMRVSFGVELPPQPSG